MAAARRKKNADVSGDGVNNKTTKRKRRRKHKLWLRVALLLVPACAIFIALSLTVLFRVTSFTVEGDVGPYSAEKIEAAAGIAPNTNLFMIDTGTAEAQIQTQLPYVETAKVTIRLPDRVVIHVTQAVPAAEIRTDDGAVLLSKSGKVLGSANGQQVLCFLNAQPSKLGVGQTAEFVREDTEQVMNALRDALQNTGLTEIKEVNLADLYSLELYYRDLYTIRIGSIANLAEKLRYAEYLIRNKLDPEQSGTLDLSVSLDQAVFRPDYDTGGVIILPEKDAQDAEPSSAPESQ